MPKLCRCGAVVEGRCKRCYPVQHKQTTKQRGYDSRWKRLSERKRALDPLCEHCLSQGRTTPASEVHHIQPISVAPHLRLAWSNLLSVCTACHQQLDHPPHQQRTPRGGVKSTRHPSATYREGKHKESPRKWVWFSASEK